jgi:hypothetical protein
MPMPLINVPSAITVSIWAPPTALIATAVPRGLKS